MPPCGQGLWLFLITGPHTGPIPGLFRAGRAAMAEELGWEVEAFDQAFGEAFQQGMVEADFKARVMWIPQAIKHNKPESPNVVKSWATEFDLIPECDLKWKAFEALKSSIHALGEAYGKAFDETFAKPSGKPLSKPSTKTSPNQEQEQEQEQEQKSPSLRSGDTATAKPRRSSRESKEEITLAAYLADCKAKSLKAIPDDHHVRTWARDAGIDGEMLQVAWLTFRDRHVPAAGDKKRPKKQADWPLTFANAVKDNWYRLWFIDGTEVKWTSQGQIQRTVYEKRLAEHNAQHPEEQPA